MIDGIWDPVNQQSSELWAGCVSIPDSMEGNKG
jgi:hypothetical protein